MSKIRQFFNTYYLPILSGFFIGTSYIPFPPWASFFCFVPLWIFWTKTASQKQIFIGGWLTQFVLVLIGFNWVSLTAYEFGHLPWPVAFLVLALFSSIANLNIPLTGIAWHFWQKKQPASPHMSLLRLALLTAFFESWIPTLFPWNYGYTFLWAKIPMAQTAEIFGFQGLSSIVILLNLFTFYFWNGRHRTNLNLRLRPLVGLLAILITLNGMGLFLQNRLTKPDAQVRVLMTQANIGNLEKEYAEKGWGFREHIFSQYARLSRDTLARQPADAAHKTDFVVWPETAYPYDLDQRQWSGTNLTSPHYSQPAQNLINLSREMDAHLITGGYGYAPQDGKVTNTFFIVEKSGRIQPDPYYKTILLAFGEFIPGAEYFPQVKNWIPAGDFSRGPGPSLNTLSLTNGNELKIGPQICYESLFHSFSRELAQKGAQVLVNLTNDSWYGTWQEPYQHLYMTLGRAVELRRPLIRSTNTGISTVVLASGQVLEKSPMRVQWTQFYDIPYNLHPPITFYQLCPWLIDTLLIFMLLALIIRSLFWKSSET